MRNNAGRGDHLVETPGLEEPTPLVGGDIRRRGAEGRQKLAQRQDLTRVRIQQGEVVAALHVSDIGHFLGERSPQDVEADVSAG